MKKVLYSIICIGAVATLIAGCSKSNVATSTTSATTLEGQVLTDFANQLVNPDYQDIQAKASIMNDAVNAFVTTPTDAN